MIERFPVPNSLRGLRRLVITGSVLAVAALFSADCVADYTVDLPTVTSTKESDNLNCLSWPVEGRISSYFGSSHPLGIDIESYPNTDVPVKAALGGVVAYAGGDPGFSYGYYVVVDHGNGVHTLYAHLREIDVKNGQSVEKQETLGIEGRTGYAVGEHLHFEVVRSGVHLDPISFLESPDNRC